VSATIFVVDDVPANVALLAKLLRDAGYVVRVATSGARALAAIAASPPDLILLDVTMPEMSGLEVCAALKARDATRQIPVIFLSALDDVRDKLSAFQAGGVDYVTKPFQADEVLARVGIQLELASARAELEARNRELEARNRELARARRGADDAFAALSGARPGTTLEGRYELAEKSGAGGFAVVFRARDREAGHDVAIKILHPEHVGDDRLRERFLAEAATVMRLPHAVHVVASGVTATGIAYLVMELLQGANLAEELRRHGPIPPVRCATLVLPVCDALVAAHGRGVIHRDIKPANIFLDRRAGEVVKVLDFGIAKHQASGAADDAATGQTTLGRVIGTPVYMAPERLAGHAYDARTDVYSLGVTLYELLSGELPFRASPAEGIGRLVAACLADPPRPLGRACPGVPGALEALVHRMLAKRADDRPSLADVRAALARIVADAAAADYAATLDSRAPVKR